MNNAKMKSPIPRLGGKRLLADEISKKFPPHRCYVEAFCGGASVFFRKDESHCEVLNDIDRNLTTFFRVVKGQPFEFLKELHMGLVSREIFEQYKRELESEGLTDVQRAARFYYLVKASFGGQGGNFGVSTTTKPKLNFAEIDMIVLLAYIRLRRTVIECLDWRECLRRYDRPHTLFYLDPPYRVLSSRQYPAYLSDADYVELRDMLVEIKGKFLLSINQDDFILDLFKRFKIEEIETTYSIEKDKSRRVTELLISNY
jgi:DNA adenine methylase